MARFHNLKAQETEDLLSRPAELKECDPVCHSLAHLGSSGVGEGHQEHHRGPGPRVLLQCRDRLDGGRGRERRQVSYTKNAIRRSSIEGGKKESDA
ncbi:hypothetical protein INR49_015310 [Caranx melampygus]|nr:hypothetical protein INR49_015310 [Caranx melampygus]